MCEPATITMVAATLISGYAAVKQGETASDIAEHNAKVENYKAQSVIQDAGLMEDRQRARVRQIRGAQLAALGASSIDPTTGTASKVLDQTTTMGELDALTIRSNALRQAWGYETQAGLDLFQGKASKQAGQLQGFGTLLAGGSRAYGMYQSGGK